MGNTCPYPDAAGKWAEMRDKPDAAYWPKFDSTGMGALAHVGPEYRKAFYDFQVACNTGPYDPNSPLACWHWCDGQGWNQDKIFINPQTDDVIVRKYGEKDPPAPYVEGGHLGVQNNGGYDTMLSSPMQYDGAMIQFDFATRWRIEQVCPGRSDEVWPYFYQSYHSPDGKKAIDDYFAQKPEAAGGKCKAALMQNDSAYSQSHYMRLNAPNWSTYWHTKPDNEFNFNGDVDWNNVFLTKTVAETNYNGHFWGNPMWNKQERDYALRLAVGDEAATGENFQDIWAQKFVNAGLVEAGKSAEDYFDPVAQAGKVSSITDPKYSGNLPYLVPYLNENAEPWHQTTNSTTAYGYNNPCNNQGFIETYLPLAAGALAAVFGGFIVPGETAKVAAAVTFGGTAYYGLKGMYGIQAAMDFVIGNSDSNPEITAAYIASLGLPATFWLALHDLGFVPEKLASTGGKVGGVVVAAGAGYFLLLPVLEPALKVGGGILSVITEPIAFFELAFTNIFNGCLAHSLGGEAVCHCEDANTKPLLIRAMPTIMGTTGAQSQLRQRCLAAAMTTGSWGTDPTLIGSCDSNGHAKSAACITAGGWAYNDPELFKDPEVARMKGEIAHCFDPANPSMLPPTAADAPCVKQFGEYFRLDPSTGKCRDFHAPVGHQDPGFVWPTDTSSSCTIL